MHTNLTVKEVEPLSGKLHVFSLYIDFAASTRAGQVAAQISKLAGPQCITSAEMWKIDTLLAGGAVRQMAANDAANADVIIVGMSSLKQREVALIEWLNNLSPQQTDRSTCGLVIGLLGDDENQHAELDWTVKSLMQCAQQTGRDFIWHWTGKDSPNNLDWLGENMDNLFTRKFAVDSEVVF